MGHSAVMPYEAQLSGISAVCVWWCAGGGLAVLRFKHGWPDWGRHSLLNLGDIFAVCLVHI